jgi:hypothetical protein
VSYYTTSEEGDGEMAMAEEAGPPEAASRFVSSPTPREAPALAAPRAVPAAAVPASAA